MIVTRFAPSPTGHLHLGHAHAALFAARAAREAGGRFLLRIEDIDAARCRPEYADAIFEDLAWLGLRWEEPVRRQSEHMADYAAALARLEDANAVYPCFCTRAEIAAEIAAAGAAPHDADPHAADPNSADPHGPGGPRYPGTCRTLDPHLRAERLARGDGHAIRLDVRKALSVCAERGEALSWHDQDRGRQYVPAARLDDVVLARKEFPASYHLAVTVDDALQGVTLVTRGEDLFFATHVHRLLQALLGLPTPDYRHHRLLTDDRGRRLAKRDKSATLRALRESGKSPAEVRALAGFG